MGQKLIRNLIRFGSNVEVRSEMDEESFEFLTLTWISPEQKPLKRDINSSRCTGHRTFFLERRRHGVSIQRGRMARGNGESMNPILKRVTTNQNRTKTRVPKWCISGIPKEGNFREISERDLRGGGNRLARSASLPQIFP